MLARLPSGLTYREKPVPFANPPEDVVFFSDDLAGLRCLDRENPGGEVAWSTWFELSASYLDVLTPGQYTGSPWILTRQ